MADVYKQLAPFKWRGIEVPTTDVSMTMSHDLVEHKYWGRDSAHVEATGRAPLRIRATIPFVAGIFPGRNEGWQKDLLYPKAFRDFTTAMADKSTGELEHPEFGTIHCKPVSFSTRLNGRENRDGVMLEAEWIETIVDGDEDFFNAPVVGHGTLDLDKAAETLEANKYDIHSLMRPEDEDGFWENMLSSDISSLVRKATSLPDKIGAATYLAAGKLSSLEYTADRLIQSFDTANNPLFWPARDAANRMREAVQKTRDHLRDKDRPVLTTKTEKTMTLAGVAASLPGSVTMGELLRLNPRLAVSPIVPHGTVIRYYAPRVK